jgi:hypothetical protein
MSRFFTANRLFFTDMDCLELSLLLSCLTFSGGVIENLSSGILQAQQERALSKLRVFSKIGE